MSTVTSSGDLSGLLAAVPFDFEVGKYVGLYFWDDHFFTAFDDFYYYNYIAVTETQTVLDAFLIDANGDAYITGVDLLQANGTINTIDFNGDGGSFTFVGSLQYSFGEIGRVDIESVSGFDGTEGFVLEGDLRISTGVEFQGQATRLLTYNNDISIEYLGKFTIDRESGVFTQITVTDASGTFSIAGTYGVAAWYAAFYDAATIDELLDTPTLFRHDDTFTVTDGTRDWHGFGGRDKMFGGAASDALYGDAGDDTLDGGAGDDLLVGGLGNDKYEVDSALDVVSELAGQGTDSVTSSGSFDLSTQGLNIENLTLSGIGNIDATGNDGRNTLTGNSGDNRIDGGLAADQMTGGGGNDTYVVDNTGDRVSDSGGTDSIETSVSFTLAAGLENLDLFGAATRGTGNASGNAITGNAIANTLSGLGGADILDGGLAGDTLTGGAGADIFTFSSADGASDTVADFNRTQGDKLDISDLLTGYDPLADDVTDFVRIDTVGTGSALFVDADGAGAGGFVQIATLSRATGLTDEAALEIAGVLITS